MYNVIAGPNKEKGRIVMTDSLQKCKNYKKAVEKTVPRGRNKRWIKIEPATKDFTKYREKDWVSIYRKLLNKNTGGVHTHDEANLLDSLMRQI